LHTSLSLTLAFATEAHRAEGNFRRFKSKLHKIKSLNLLKQQTKYLTEQKTFQTGTTENDVQTASQDNFFFFVGRKDFEIIKHK
jgi:hypothetical protein